jgi:starvation-inducible DNA-binding protein
MDLVTGLRVYLATNFAFYLKTHNAHWNVTGMFFPQLHALFGDQYEDLFAQVDIIAEKIRELDRFAPGSMREYMSLSLIDELEGVLDATGYVERLLKDHERMIMFLNKLFVIAESANNQAIMNYIAERLDAHAKARWQLRTIVNPVGGAPSSI